MKKILFISISLIILMFGCKKDKESNITSEQLNLSQFISKYSPPSQFFNVTAGQSSNITGANGTIIKINQNSFYPLMSGNVKIELREFYSRKDIILGNLQTISDNNLLATAGMIYIDVSQNGDDIYNWNVRTIMPAQTTNTNMKLFFSNTMQVDSSINWVLSDTSFLFLDTNNTYFGIINSFLRYIWINCDYFVDQSPVTTVKATFTNAPLSTFAPQVYLVLDINAIAHMWFDYPNQGVFAINNIPEGLTGKIVAFTVVNGVYYFSKQPITVTTNLNQQMTFQTVTEQQLITELENL